MSSLLVGQSGGPTSVINASLAGVIAAGFKNKIDNIYGAVHGIAGIIKEDFVKFEPSIVEEIKYVPASYLGSVRYKLEKEEDYQKILEVFIKYDIRYFFYIGGNDSMDTCNKISKYFKKAHFDCKVIGVPKTIDNDLVGISHTPGYGSAAKYIATTISEITLDASVYEKGRVNIIEIMGRDAGWLTAASALAKINGFEPDFIYLPEVPFDLEQFLEDVKERFNQNKKVIVCVSEGIKDKNGKYILEYRTFNNDDVFGHLQLGGVGEVLAEYVSKKLNLPYRAIELSLPQRCAMHVASKADVDYAYKLGEKAVNAAIKGKTDLMASDNKKWPNLKDVAGLVKQFPTEWIIDGKHVSDEYLNYAIPFIKGEVKLKYYNGLPVYKKRSN